MCTRKTCASMGRIRFRASTVLQLWVNIIKISMDEVLNVSFDDTTS